MAEAASATATNATMVVVVAAAVATGGAAATTAATATATAILASWPSAGQHTRKCVVSLSAPHAPMLVHTTVAT